MNKETKQRRMITQAIIDTEECFRTFVEELPATPATWAILFPLWVMKRKLRVLEK